MYYFTNIPDISPDNNPHQTKKLSLTLTYSKESNYYQLNSPFLLQFETFHPESEDNAMVFSSLAPESSFYSVLSLEDIEKNRDKRLHQHDYYELVFVIEGEMYQTIEHQRHLYTTGSCCLLNRNIRHTEELSTNFRAVFLAMSNDFLYDLFRHDQTSYFSIERNRSETSLEKFINSNQMASNQNEKGYLDFILIRDLEWVKKNIHDIFDQISHHILNPDVGSSLMIKGLFYKLLHLLDTSEDYHTTPIQLGNDMEVKLFNEVTALMKTSNGRIPRNELEKIMNYSGDYINKIVKKFTGLTIFDYGMTYCMNEATRLLKETSLSVSEIAVELNFTNRAHFYKLFQESYGISPKQYRNNQKSNSHL